MLPACFSDLHPASNLLLKPLYVGNDKTNLSGWGFASSPAGCWMHFCAFARLAVYMQRCGPDGVAG